MGIEPTYPAWKAGVLPLNYTRIYAETVMLLQQSGWQDSNLRPPGPKPGALAKLSHTPMSYNIISMKLSFLVLSRISFLSLKARVIILYGLPFVNTFFINFYIFFEKRCNSRKPAKNAGFQALHHLHFSLFRLFSKKYFKKHFISTVKHTSIFSYKYRISISGSSPLYSSITA